eukprot:PhM_4_TR10606/c0_g1_i2/m.104858
MTSQHLCQHYDVQCTIKKLTGGELRGMHEKHPESTFAIWWRRGRKTHNQGLTPFAAPHQGTVLWKHATTMLCTASKSIHKAKCEPKAMRLSLLQRCTDESELQPIGQELCIDLAQFMTGADVVKELWFPYFLSDTATAQLYLRLSVHPVGPIMSARDVPDLDTTVGSVCGSDDEDAVCLGDVVRCDESTTNSSVHCSREAQQLEDDRRALVDARRQTRERVRLIEQLELENEDLRFQCERVELQVLVERKRARMLTKAQNGDGVEACMCARPCIVL